MAENKELAEEGMMFVGDKGKILGGFRGEGSRLLGKGSKQPDAASREGIAIARGIAAELRGAVQGVQVSTPSGNIDAALAVLDGLR